MWDANVGSQTKYQFWSKYQILEYHSIKCIFGYNFSKVRKYKVRIGVGITSNVEWNYLYLLVTHRKYVFIDACRVTSNYQQG